MKHARTISVGSCARDHVHLVLADETGAPIGAATLSWADWQRFVGLGAQAFITTEGLAPVTNTFELETRPCPDAP